MRALRGNEGPQRAAQVRHAARTASVNTSSSCLVHERTVDSSQVMRATRHRQPSLRHAGPALTPACRPGPHSGMQAQSSLQHAGTALTQACRPGHHSGMQAWPSLRHADMALTQACRQHTRPGRHSGMQVMSEGVRRRTHPPLRLLLLHLLLLPPQLPHGPQCDASGWVLGGETEYSGW